jgi:hypothetical protein
VSVGKAAAKAEPRMNPASPRESKTTVFIKVM